MGSCHDLISARKTHAKLHTFLQSNNSAKAIILNFMSHTTERHCLCRGKLGGREGKCFPGLKSCLPPTRLVNRVSVSKEYSFKSIVFLCQAMPSSYTMNLELTACCWTSGILDSAANARSFCKPPDV